jgi:hypothetical protein
MTEWTDPRYVTIMATMRRAHQARAEGRRPVRGFLVPQDK